MSRLTKTYVNDFDAPSRPRNVIVCLDGTWNDETGESGDGVVTNVVKLYRSLARDGETQISRYFRGLGNDDDNNRAWRLVSGAFGFKERRIRNDAYSTIVKEHRNGDRIFLLGFSRGAASARMLAAQLHREGIRETIRITTRARSNRSSRHVESRYVRHEVDGARREADVTFLGVWDTVGAFGIPVKLLGVTLRRWDLFADMHVAPNVRHAVHAVAVDETRKAYAPTLMNHRPGVVEEVWLPGVHADVGGAYAEDELGRIALRFMAERMAARARAAGAPEIVFDEARLERYTRARSDEVDFHFHGLGFHKGIRPIHVLAGDRPDPALRPRIHRSVVDLRRSAETYSRVRGRRGRARRFLIQYNPVNVKALNGRYEVVE